MSGKDFVQSHRLIVPIHTADIIDLVLIPVFVQPLGEPDFHLCLLCRVGMSVQVDCPVSMTIV